MGWNWRYADIEGGTVQPRASGELPSPSFPTQADAESWIGETWHELFAGGVEAVYLLDDDTVVYGPMSLRAPD
jgi:hypothetical protein